MPIGFLVGKFQPLHVGHELSVREIKAAGYTPAVVICTGDADIYKVPPSVLEKAFRDIGVRHIRVLHDTPNWDDWYSKLISCMTGVDINAMTVGCLFHGGKEVDRYHFTYNGKEYAGCDWIEPLPIEKRKVEHAGKFMGTFVNARDIRLQPDLHADYINPLVRQHIQKAGITW